MNSRIQQIEDGIDDLSQIVDLVSSSDPEVRQDPAAATEIHTQFNAGKAQINLIIRDVLREEHPPPEDIIESWDQQLLSLDLEFHRAIR